MRLTSWMGVLALLGAVAASGRTVEETAGGTPISPERGPFIPYFGRL
jgi:hypothetical protein